MEKLWDGVCNDVHNSDQNHKCVATSSRGNGAHNNSNTRKYIAISSRDIDQTVNVPDYNKCGYIITKQHISYQFMICKINGGSTE